ncbi:MAG: hypothetical protein NTZ15_09840 [Burkholderiales bacterium]|nr:hypothetical protein [Burkholderiales bacterium]
MAWVKKQRVLVGAILLSVLGHLAAWWGLQSAKPRAPPVAAVQAAPVLQVQLLATPSAVATITQAARAPAPLLAYPHPVPAVQAEPDPFIPAELLDHPLVPRSAPDTALLDGLSFTGLPVRLRLYVDALGRVVDVVVLQADAGDEEAVAHMKAMFLATAYIPGQLQGAVVPARQDIELSLGDAS